VIASVQSWRRSSPNRYTSTEALAGDKNELSTNIYTLEGAVEQVITAKHSARLARVIAAD
jgi:hypothetical protein